MPGENAGSRAEQAGVASQDAYNGPAGKTRTESFHVWMPDGSVRSLRAFVAVDAVADPALAGLARAGSLHHVAEGVELALPYCYHDREVQLFLLVVPEVLRHRAVAFRAEQLALIAADTENAVPPYVLACEVAIGTRELNMRLGQSGDHVLVDSLLTADPAPGEDDDITEALDDELEAVDEDEPEGVEALADDTPDEEMVEARPAEAALPMDALEAEAAGDGGDLIHPFGSETDKPPKSATEAAINLDELLPWLAPSRRAWLVAAAGLTPAHVERRARTIMEQALDWGLDIPPGATQASLLLLRATGEDELVRRRIAGLCRVSADPARGGLEESVLRAMWAGAVADAARLGIELSAQARALAHKHAAEHTAAHAEALSDASHLLTEGDSAGFADLEVVAAKGGMREVLALGRHAATLDADRTAALFASLGKRSDLGSLDALNSMLARADELRVRVGAALALAARQAPAAIAPLATCVGREPDPAWLGFAIALGRFGGGSFRAIARALHEAGAPEERVALTYAYLVRHGARAQVRSRSRSADAREARIAQQALDLSATLDGLGPDSPRAQEQGWLTAFCRRFDAHAQNAQS